MDREETAAEKMPVLFVGQGPPMNAIEQKSVTQAGQRLSVARPSFGSISMRTTRFGGATSAV